MTSYQYNLNIVLKSPARCYQSQPEGVSGGGVWGIGGLGADEGGLAVAIGTLTG